jgi:hypothetical protein
MRATSMPCSVAGAELKDLNPFICLVSFLMNLWSLDRQANAQQSPGGVLEYVVQILDLQDFYQPESIVQQRRAIHVL